MRSCRNHHWPNDVVDSGSNWQMASRDLSPNRCRLPDRPCGIDRYWLSMTCVGDVDLLWARGRPRIGPTRRLGPFGPSSGAQPRLGFFGESLESIVTASGDDDERNIQDTPGLAHLGHALFGSSPKSVMTVVGD